MEVGLGLIFPGTGSTETDAVIYRDQMDLVRFADNAGFDSIWATEHHFSEYQISPDPLQILTYVAGQTKNVKLGTNAVILPWNDPTRVAERVTVLDTFSGGRFLLGIGRGLGELEFSGFGVPMGESRARFIEAAAMVRDALEDGYIESKGEYYTRDRREIRPQPLRSFRDRRWAVAISPESFDVVAELGYGLLCQPQKPWDVIRKDTEGFWDRYTRIHDEEPIPGVTCAFVYCDRDRVKAREEGQRRIGIYHDIVTEFYGLKGGRFDGKPGYEFYAKNAKSAQDAGDDVVRNLYTSVQVWGTPEECIDKIMHLREATRCGTFVGNFSYAGLSVDESKHMLQLFADEVVPVLRPVSPVRG